MEALWWYSVYGGIHSVPVIKSPEVMDPACTKTYPSSTVPQQPLLLLEHTSTPGFVGTPPREQAAASPAPLVSRLISQPAAQRQLTAPRTRAAHPAPRHALRAPLRSHTRLPASPWPGRQFHARIALFAVVCRCAAGSRAVSIRCSERHGYRTYLHTANCSPLHSLHPNLLPSPVPAARRFVPAFGAPTSFHCVCLIAQLDLHTFQS